MFKRKNLQGYNLSKKSYLKRRHLPRFLLGLLLAVTSTSALTIRHEITANGDIPFITTWRVSGDQAGRTVKIPTHSEPIKINQVSYNYTIDWGDGTGIETKTDNTVPVHTYAVDGDYQIKIRGTFPGWTFLNNNSHTITDEEHAIMAKKIIKLNQWGNIKWQSFSSMFDNAENMVGAYTDNPDTSAVVQMDCLFRNAKKFNSPVNFDTRNVINMNQMFKGATIFNQPVNFNTGKVIGMHAMFSQAEEFNQPVNFDTRKVDNLSYMFENAIRFNHPVNFNTESAVTTTSMFENAQSFNQPVNFNTSKVYIMKKMFYRAKRFNHPVNFDTSNVTDMYGMFGRTEDFNQPLNFDTRKVTDMSFMFSGAKSFNKPVNFNTEQLVDIDGMFKNTAAFNQPINFNLSKVIRLTAVFDGAAAFNQDLSHLDYSHVQYLNSFVSDSKLSVENNDKLIKRWYAQLGHKDNIDPISTGLKFCAAKTERRALIAKNWGFRDEEECTDAFITIWYVSGDESGRTVKIPTYQNLSHVNNVAYNYSIDWGDESIIESKTDSTTPVHTYNRDGNYEIKIRGVFPGWSFSANPKDSNLTDPELINMPKKISKIKQWGTNKWQNMRHMFHGAEKMISDYNDAPDTSEVKSMEAMFRNAKFFNGEVNFNTSQVTNFADMFYNNLLFNKPVNFDTSSATNISNLFYRAINFDQPINFDTHRVTNMDHAFFGTQVFNQDLSHLDYTKVTNLLDFVSNSNLSTINNDKLINRWHTQLSSTNNQLPTSSNLTFCRAKANRATLLAKNWTFADTENCSAYNQPPQDINLSKDHFNENNSSNFEVGTLTATLDPEDKPTPDGSLDSTTGFSLSCNTPGADDGSFAVNANKLIFQPVANFETKSTYQICLRAKDTFNATKDKNFTIRVNDINEAPIILPQTFTVVENSVNGTAVGQITAAEEDQSQTISYELVSGNELDIFEVTPSGQLKVKNNTNLDYEKSSQIILVVRAKDNASPQLSAQNNITVNITNLDEAPSFTSADHITVNEDEIKTHQLTAIDTEVTNLTFSTEILPSWITISDSQLTLRPTQAQVGHHQIIVKASDGTYTTSQTLNIQVDNVNDAPVITSTPILQATKFQAYSYIISATDEDGDTLTYSATTKPTWLNFDPVTRELSGTPGNDEAGNSYPIVLTVSDSIASVNQSFNIQVTDQNSSPVINDQTFTIDENSTNGTEIGQIIATDPDNQPLSYEIISGNVLNIFEIAADGKLKIKDHRKLDYEFVKKVVLRVKVSDNQSPALTDEAEITINIQNINEEPTITSADQISFRHDEAKTHTLTATDPENDILSFHLLEPLMWLELTNNQLTLHPTEDEIGDHYVTVIVDDGINQSTQNLHIVVLAGNLAPTLNPQTFTVTENSTNGTEVGQIIATDPNSSDLLAFELVSGNDLDIFEVTPDGKLKVKNNTKLDYEQVNQSTLVVKVSDNQTPPLSHQNNITVTIQDVNEAPNLTSDTTINLSSTEIKTHTLTAIDPENNPLTFTATGLPAWINLTGNQLTLTPSSAEIGSHQITIQISDGANITNQIITVNVAEDNLAPVITNQAFTIAENIANTTEVGTLTATDPNAGQILAFELVNGNDLNIFELTPAGKLIVKDNRNLDYEHLHQVVLTVRVKDNGFPVLSAQAFATIDVTDVDDEAPYLTLNNSPITITEGDSFTPPAATCHDNQSSCTLTVNNQVNPHLPGTYLVIYTGVDTAGNQTIVHVQVIVKPKPSPIPPIDQPGSNPNQPNPNQNPNPQKPSTSDQNKPENSDHQDHQDHQDNHPPFIIKGDAEIFINQGESYSEPGIECLAVVNCSVKITGKVDTTKPGTYIISYRSTDPAYSTTRRVIVRPKSTASTSDKDFFAALWDLLGRYWFFLLATPFLLWLILLFFRRRKEDHKQNQKRPKLRK